MARRIIANRPKTRKHAHLHAIRRAAERYGITLTKDDIDKLARRIGRKGGGTYLATQSGTRSLWLVEHNGVQLKVVYQKRLRAILTVLSMDMVTRAEKAQQRKEASHDDTASG